MKKIARLCTVGQTYDVKAKQNCHRLRKAEMSPKALTVARLSSPETQGSEGC